MKTKNYSLFLSCLVLLVALAACTSHKAEPEFNEPKCFEDILGSRIAFGVGSTYDVGLEDVKDFERLYVAGSEGLLAVSNGKADYTIMDSTAAHSIDLKSMGLEIKFGGVVPHGYSLLFSRKDPEFCDKFNEFLKYANESGLYKKLHDKWTTDINAPKKKDDVKLPTSGKTLTVGIGGTAYPWVYHTAEGPSGFQPDMMDYFSAWSGMPVKYLTADNNSLPAMLETGKVDCLFYPLQRTPEREKAILFSDPYFYEAGVVIGRIHNTDGNIRPNFKQRFENSVESNLIIENRWKMLVEGLWITLVISLMSIIASLFSGALICAMRMSKSKILSGIAKGFIAVVRCIPMLVLLMIMFYVIFGSSRIEGTWISVVCFAIYFGAYFSEVFRSGIEGVAIGQYEAGAALGFTKFQTFRLVVLPQALVRSIPVLKGEIITLIKSTSLVGYVAIQDLTRASDLIRTRTMDAFFLLLLVALVYAIISWTASILLNLLEKRITPKAKAI